MLLDVRLNVKYGHMKAALIKMDSLFMSLKYWANFCTKHIPSVCVAHLCGWDTFVQQRCVTFSFLTFSLV